MCNLCGTACAAGWCTICTALYVLQADAQFVGHFVFCRLLYKLCGALCSAGWCTSVRHFVCCRLMCNLCGAICSAGWCTTCAALRVLQAVVQVVGHFVFCRPMYNLWALCVLRADVQFVGNFVFCRLLYNLCGTLCSTGCCTSCAKLRFVFIIITAWWRLQVCVAVIKTGQLQRPAKLETQMRLYIRPPHSRFRLQSWDLLASAILTPGNSECIRETWTDIKG
jgi:hypothetical protein